MSKLILKVRMKNGNMVIDHLTSDNTVLDLKKIVSAKMGLPYGGMVLMNGFPPRALDRNIDDLTLGEAGINSGDSLCVDETSMAVNSSGVVNFPDLQRRPHVQDDNSDVGVLLRQIVPADNSCLFTSIGFVLGGKIDTTCGQYMRKIIAEQVASNQEKYSEAILGKPNSDYCKWIQKPDSWGGAIELAVLSDFYGVEIAVVDTVNSVINRFGEDKEYDYRVFLIFDGIHYDPLYRESFGSDGAIQTMFHKTNHKVLLEAEELAREAKSSKQFTDVDKFSLRCQICRVELQGQGQAQVHAKQTGHMNFGEISRS